MILITIREGQISSITTDIESEQNIDIQVLDWDFQSLEAETAGYDPKFINDKIKEYDKLSNIF